MAERALIPGLPPFANPPTRTCQPGNTPDASPERFQPGLGWTINVNLGGVRDGEGGEGEPQEDDPKEPSKVHNQALRGKLSFHDIRSSFFSRIKSFQSRISPRFFSSLRQRGPRFIGKSKQVQAPRGVPVHKSRM